MSTRSTVNGHPESAEDLLRRVASWPSIRVDRRGCRATLRAGVVAAAIAKLDLQTAALVVDVPCDMVGALPDDAPQRQPQHDGVRLDVSDADSRRAAIALLRWRTDIERFAWQYRNASP